MRLLHTSDWHMGRTLHGADLSPAIDLFIDWLVEVIDEHHVDALIVSGDVYDRAIPPVTAIRQLSGALSRVVERVPVVVTSGNHDSAVRLGFGAQLMREDLRIVTDAAQVGRAVPVTSQSGERVLVYPIPYLEPETTRHELTQMLADRRSVSSVGEATVASLGEQDALFPVGDEAPPAQAAEGQAVLVARSHQGVLDAAMSLVWKDLKQRRAQGDESPAVAMVHAFVTGAEPSDSEHDIRVGGVEYVSASTFDGPEGCELAYVAAGHLHRPQDVRGAQVPIRYSGSPVAYSFSEAQSVKGVTLVDVSHGAALVVEHLPCPVWRPVAVIRGLLEELLGPNFAQHRQSFVHVTVTDPVRPEHMLVRVREIFPHALVVLHDSGRTVDTSRAPELRAAPSDAQISTDFFAEIGGRPLSDAEDALVENVWSALRQAEASA